MRIWTPKRSQKPILAGCEDWRDKTLFGKQSKLFVPQPLRLLGGLGLGCCCEEEELCNGVCSSGLPDSWEVIIADIPNASGIFNGTHIIDTEDFTCWGNGCGSVKLLPVGIQNYKIVVLMAECPTLSGNHELVVSGLTVDTPSNCVQSTCAYAGFYVIWTFSKIWSASQIPCATLTDESLDYRYGSYGGLPLSDYGATVSVSSI